MRKSQKKKAIDAEQVDLLRGGNPVRTLLGSFGASLRETRLTSVLGYLFAQEAEPWQRLFRIRDPISRVTIEFSREAGRADIWLESASQSIVVEAKVTGTDPTAQSRKYRAGKAILLSDNSPPSSQLNARNLYFDWDRIASFLQHEYHDAAKGRPHLQFLAKEVVRYMAENSLIRSGDILEVYVREINTPTTLTLFLKGHLYTCPYEKAGKASQALYFAPHFGQKLARDLPGIYAGISFVAKIEAVEVVDSWKLFRQAIKKRRGGHWLNSSGKVIAPLQQQLRKSKEQWTMLFLSEPRLVFNPPINKSLLQKGTGYLSRREFSFDKLFEAWARSSSVRLGV